MNLILIREHGQLAQELIDQGFSVKLIRLKSRLDPFGLMRLKRELADQEPDLLHCHMYRSSVPGTIAGHYAGVRHIFSQVHNVGTWESSRQKNMDRWLAKWRAGTIAVSEAVKRDVIANLGIADDRVPVLYNGCDTDKFRPDSELRQSKRQELRLENRMVFLVPARLHPNKFPLMVAESFLKATREFKSGESPVLLFAGSGPLEEYLRGFLENKQADDRVRLLGKRDDMVGLYNACDAMILSSAKEGFSNAVVESLSCGKPVIAADVGGNREVITTDRHGWIHESADGEKLTEQIQQAIEARDQLPGWEKDCREQGIRFSLDAMVNATEKLYRDTIEGRFPGKP